jgi:hypothetical protein
MSCLFPFVLLPARCCQSFLYSLDSNIVHHLSPILAALDRVFLALLASRAASADHNPI